MSTGRSTFLAIAPLTFVQVSVTSTIWCTSSSSRTSNKAAALPDKNPFRYDPVFETMTLSLFHC